MKKKYDVVIVGAGPAAIFTALELYKRDGLRILMLEKGKDISERSCRARETSCAKCEPCSITSGWGGAGAFSDGKLTLSAEIGGSLIEYMSRSKLEQLIKAVDDIYIEFGAPERIYGNNEEEIAFWQHRAVLADLTLVPSRIRHLGTERCRDVLESMRSYFERDVEVKTSTKVAEILTGKGKVEGVVTDSGDRYLADFVVVAPGREGADWLAQQMNGLGAVMKTNAVDIGLRVEVPAPILEPLTDDLYEPKLIYYTKNFEDQVRTFCMNPYGVVCVERYGDLLTVNGHSYAETRTDYSNFALLVSTSFTEPFKEPIAYGEYIARLANLLGEGILIQRLGDLLGGRRSTAQRIKRSTVKPTLREATPGDLSFVLPYRYISDILEMLEAMDKLCPGIYSKNSLLYGVEVKFYSSRPKLTRELETEIKSLYAIGDGAGITRGLVQASASGVVVARSILSKLSQR